jgi:hypothetical protein
MEVWFKLDDEEANMVDLTEEAIVYHLRRAVKDEFANTLRDIDAGHLKVYAPNKGTDIEKSLASNKKVFECRASSYKKPSIVKTPPKQPQQPNGKLQCCRCCSRIVVF